MMKKKYPFFQWGQACHSVVNHRHGSSTMEYIIIISVAIIFAGVLYTYFTENGTLKESVQNKVEQAILGEAEIGSSSGEGAGSSNGSGNSPTKDGFLGNLFSNPLDHPLGKGSLLAGFPMFGGNILDDFLKVGKIGGIVEPGCAAGDYCSIYDPEYNQYLKEQMEPSIYNYKPTPERPYGNLKDVRLTDLQLARFSHMAYADFDHVYDEKRISELVGEPGWIEDTKYRKYNETDGRIDHGFQVKVFVNEKRKEMVIAYRGSDEFYDYIGPDIQLGLVRHTDTLQYDLARSFYDELSNDPDYKGYQKIQTGHSLGGHVAQYMALQNHVPTITFNGPGLNFRHPVFDRNYKNLSYEKYKNNQDGKYNNLVRNYTFNGDVVGSINTHVGESYNIDVTGFFEKKLEVEKANDFSVGHAFYDMAGKFYHGWYGNFIYDGIFRGGPGHNHKVGHLSGIEGEAKDGSPSKQMDRNHQVIYKNGDNIVPR